MRIKNIWALPLIGLLVIFSACVRPALTAPVTPVPVVASPANPAPETSALVTPVPVTTTPAFPVPAPGQTVFTVSDLRINPEVLVLGGSAVVSVNVSNTGKERGTYTVVLKVSGKIARTQDITLDGGASGKVELSLQPEFPWEYQIAVAQLTGRLDVVTQQPVDLS